MALRRAFFAYASEPNDLRFTVEQAAELVSNKDTRLVITTWPNLEAVGAHIADNVRKKIADSDFLIADVTIPNFNVYYEIGYAIGRGIPILPVINSAFADAAKATQSDGFFDNIKYESYENSQQLVEVIERFSGTILLDIYAHELNREQPLYFLDTYAKTDFRNSIVSSIKSSRVFYRSFDPVETPRFSTTKIIAEITASVGAVVPFLLPSIRDASRHNLRASFLAGILQGLGREVLLLQNGESPIPADYRESVEAIRSPNEVRDIVTDFATTSLKAFQTIHPPKRSKNRVTPTIQRLWLGASAAENEFRTLERYFLETSEYIRTIKGDGRVVVGRKGSGKTAIFFMARDNFRKNKLNTVVDLKPESYELLKLREVLEEFASVGVMQHAFSGFWTFLALVQIAIQIRNDARARSKFDHKALEVVVRIEEELARYSIPMEGDFTSRLQSFIASVASSIGAEARRNGGKIPPERVTNFVYGAEQKRLRQFVASVAPDNGTICVLFDNLDKGWPATGVEATDTQYLRALIEALSRMQRDMSGLQVDLQYSVFLRNDIYELLIGETSDRGKEAAIRIDWNDREKLRLLVGKRIAASIDSEKSANAIWNEHFPSHVLGVDGLDYVIDHCLMRPRFLIDIIERAISFAINREHGRVSEDDIVDAIKQHAYYLVDDFGYEIRDASSFTNEILDAFLGSNKLISEAEVKRRLSAFIGTELELQEGIDLLVWYGFLGIVNVDAEERYIYDFNYSMRRIKAEIKRLDANLTFAINDAFFVGLN